MVKSVPPSIREKAFNCPHCGAFTTQHWFDVYASAVNNNLGHPNIPDKESRDEIQNSDMDLDIKRMFMAHYDRIQSRQPFWQGAEASKYVKGMENIYVSECYACGKLAVWVHDGLIYPPTKEGVDPNQDFPEKICNYFEEARSIVGLSPRGAAALLRLCIQLLCQHLGEKGKDLDKDIASLVAKGLDPLVQKSLDIVRVIGNEAVHPGVIDLEDNRDTAIQLFELVNTIADQMISHPKKVNALYESLPEGKRKSIEERDRKARENQK